MFCKYTWIVCHGPSKGLLMEWKVVLNSRHAAGRNSCWVFFSSAFRVPIFTLRRWMVRKESVSFSEKLRCDFCLFLKISPWKISSRFKIRKTNQGCTIHMNDQNPPVTWTMECWLVNYWILIIAIFWIPPFFGCSRFPNPPGWLAFFGVETKKSASWMKSEKFCGESTPKQKLRVHHRKR